MLSSFAQLFEYMSSIYDVKYCTSIWKVFEYGINQNALSDDPRLLVMTSSRKNAFRIDVPLIQQYQTDFPSAPW